MLKTVGLLCLSILITESFSEDSIRLGLPLGHTNIVFSACFSPNSKLVASASFDGTAKIWEVKTGRLLFELRGIGDRMNSVQFSHDGKLILTSGLLGTSKLWSAETGHLLIDFTGIINLFNAFSHFSPDGKFIILNSMNDILLFETASGKLLRTFKGHTEKILCAQFSPNGEQIVSGSEDNTSKIWEVRTGALLKNLIGHKALVKLAQYSPDGNKIITAAYDNTVMIWDAATGELKQNLVQNIDSVNAAIFSPDGEKIAVSFVGSIVKIWNARTGMLLYELKDHTGVINKIEFSPDSKTIVTASVDKTAKIWDIETGKLLHDLKLHSGPVNSASFNLGGNLLITTSFDHSVKIWNAINGELIRDLKGHLDILESARFSDEGKYIVVNKRYEVKFINTDKGNLFHRFSGHTGFISSVDLSPDGNMLLTTSLDSTARLWDIKTGRIIYTMSGLTGKTYEGHTAQFSPDGTSIFTLTNQNLVKMWDAKSGNLQKEFLLPYPEVESSDISPDTKKIVAAIENREINIWDIRNGELIVNLQSADLSHKPDFFTRCSVSFSHDGKYIGAAFGDSIVKIWDVETGFLKQAIGCHVKKVHSVLFSPDCKQVATIADFNIKLWDINTGKLLQDFNFPGMTTNINFANFSPDGLKLIIRGVEFSEVPQMLICDLRSGEYNMIPNLKTGVTSASYSLNNNAILITTENANKCMVWDANARVELLTFMLLDTMDYINLLPSMYYQCSKNAASKLYYIKGLQTIGFDQLDIKYNRPDKVLQALGDAFGNPDTALINLYYKAWQKRIKKLGIDTSSFEEGYSVPESDFKNRDELTYEQTNGKLQLQITGMDSTYALDRFNVWVNEVPIFGERGINIRSSKRNQLDTVIIIDLSIGENKLETSVLNVNGIESYRIPLYVKYTPGILPVAKTYYVGIGVSNYKDNSHNLSYAEKDITDISKTFIGADTIILRNEKATKENILALKQKLLKTTIEDQVILSVSGHGILSDSLDFYFATYDMDFEHPERRGLLYDDLENLLDSIPARKKLLMIDACHSGEVDKDDTKIDKVLLAQSGVKQIEKPKGGQTLVSKNVIGLKNTFELMQELFANVSKGTGAVVISASGGKEYALESGKWNNGVFTYCVRKALEEKAADRDNDNEISISELKEYVSKEVERLTQGRQKPTARKENLEVDWVVK